jgi:hypothetical protein
MNDAGRVRRVPAPPGFYGCPRCLKVKPVSDFTRQAKGPDGHSSMCKPCKLAWKVARREAMRGRADPTIEARFWPKVDKNGPLFEGTPCWVWTGAKSNRGYGAIYYQGADCPAHRVSMELHGVPVDASRFVVDHRCKNIACVNPAHLRVCTQVENTTIYADRSRTGEKVRATWAAKRQARQQSE